MKYMIRQSIVLLAFAVAGCAGTTAETDDLASTSQAYRFGVFNFANLLGGDALIEPGCTQQIPHSSIEAYWVQNYNEEPHLWGPEATALLEELGLPTMIIDEGENCALYSGTVSYVLNGEWQSQYSSDFRAGIAVTVPYNDPKMYPSSYTFYMYKTDVCSGINNWHASRGAGGPGWNWGVYGTYYRSGPN